MNKPWVGDCSLCPLRGVTCPRRGVCYRCHRTPAVRSELPTVAPRPWTRITEQAVECFARQGMTAAAIGRRVGRTASAVRKKWYDLGVRRQRNKGELAAAVRRLARPGVLFDWEIAIRLDVTPACVARVRRRQGLPAADAAQSGRARKKWSSLQPEGGADV